MTREEKAEYRARQLEKELNDLKRQNAVSDMAKTARKMLADEEINLPDEVIFNLVSEDAEQTKTAVEAFAKTFKEAVQAAVKDALRGTTPKAAGKPYEITKEQILNVKDTNEGTPINGGESRIIHTEVNKMKKFNLQLFAAEPNTITTQQFSINPREVDFVTSFGRNITALTEVMGIARPIRKANGTQLVAKRATGELQNGSVAEGGTTSPPVSV